ncbi:MAG TPA: hypothetical protein VHV55_18705 [Pirellulales bacterium]|nr:hypothetical protein [Pirellulales bacterium]
MRSIKLTHRLWLAAAACLLIGGTVSLSLAQPPRGRPPGGGMPPRPPADARFRDPTQPSPEMREAIEAAQTVPAGPGPAAAAPVMPEIKMKARLLGAIGPPVAMLEVNGRLLVMHQGEESTIANPGGGILTLVVRDLSATGVTIEVLPLKKILNLQ